MIDDATIERIASECGVVLFVTDTKSRYAARKFAHAIEQLDAALGKMLVLQELANKESHRAIEAEAKLKALDEQEPINYLKVTGSIASIPRANGDLTVGFTIPAAQRDKYEGAYNTPNEVMNKLLGKLYSNPIPPADVAELQSNLDKSTALIQEIAGIAFEHILPNETTLGLPHLLRSQFGRIAELERRLAEHQAAISRAYDSLPIVHSQARSALLSAQSSAELNKLLSEAREEGRKEAESTPVPRMTSIESGAGYASITLVYDSVSDCEKVDAMLAAAPSPASLNAKEGGE